MEDLDVVKRLLALVVYIGAFVAIPFLAKRFAGLLGQLTGSINDKSRGLIDRPRNRLREFGQNRIKARKAVNQAKSRAMVAKGVDPEASKLRQTAQTVNLARKSGSHKAREGLDRYEKGGRFRDQKNMDVRRQRRMERAQQRRSKAPGGSLRQQYYDSPFREATSNWNQNRRQRQAEATNTINQELLNDQAEQFAPHTYALDTNRLRELAVSTKTTRGQSLAAINELARREDTQSIRQIVEMTQDPQSGLGARRVVADAMSSANWRKSLMATDPDLATARIAANESVEVNTDILSQLPPIQTQKWSVGTWAKALEKSADKIKLRQTAQDIVDIPIARVNLRPEVLDYFAKQGIRPTQNNSAENTNP